MRKKLFTLIILIFLSLSTTFFAVKVEANSNCKDLTSTKLIYQRVGYSNLKINSGVDGNDIALLYQGEKRTFEKGFTAHANAEVVYAFDFPNEIDNTFQEFRAYVGNSYYTKNNGDGIKIKIFSGKRKLNKNYNDRGSYDWFSEYESKKPVKGTDEAEFVKISLNDRHALKFVVERVGNITADHGTIAEPILCKPDYVEEANNVINNKAFYEEKIKSFDYQNQDILTIQKDLYHYYLIKNVGFYDLNRFANKSEEHKVFLNYLLNDKEFLSLFVLGGKPQNNNYLKVLEILKKLYTKNSADLTDNTIYPETNVKKSTLAKKMMISIALVNETPVKGMFGDLISENQFGSKPESNPLLRYEIYKFLRDNKAPSEENGHNYLDVKVFDNLPVEYMRWVFDTEMMEDEIKWLNYWARKKQGFRENDFSSGGYAFVRYTDGNDHVKFVKEKRIALPGDPVGEENFKIYEKKWELDKFGIKNDKHVRIWVVHESGQVCGGISKHGSAMLSSVGRPSNVVGQPGHGAYINYYFDNSINDFKWKIDTDISGIWESERWQRMPLDIRHTSRIHPISYNMPHLYLTQIILKEYDKYEKSFLLDILASANLDNKNIQINIYNKIRQIQPLNFLATIKLIETLKKNGELEDFVKVKKLFEELIEDYILYPMAIRDFYFLFSKYTNDAVNRQEIINMYNKTLSRIINNTPNTFMYKNEVVKTAKYYLGKTNDFATFSFSGEKANKIVLDSQYQNISIKVRYSLDNKQTFKIVDNLTEITLTEEELAILNSEHGIYVGLVGTEKLYHISIEKGILSPSDFVINPIKKIVESKNINLEWSNDNINFTIPNTRFSLDENKTIYFRLKRYDKKDYSNVIEINYSVDNEFSYIDNSQVEIVELLEGQRDHEKEKINDGLLLTHYHTKNKSNQVKKIVFKFLEDKKIDKIIYYPRYDIPERFSQIKEFSVFYKTSENSEYIKIGDYVIEEVEKPFEILTKLENVLYVKFEVSKSTHHEAGNNFYIAGSEIAFLNKVNQTPKPSPIEIVTYYDENGVEILHQIEKGNPHPTAKEGFEWIAVPNEVNMFGLIKSDILKAIQVFENYKFDDRNDNEIITIHQVFDFEIKEVNTSLLNIQDESLSLKNKNISENVTIQIEIKVINPYVLNKTYIKMVTFSPSKKDEVIEFYDEKGNISYSISKKESFKKPELDSKYVWFELNNNKFQKVLKEKNDAYLNFKKIETFKYYEINSIIDLGKEIGFNFTIKNSNIKYQDSKLIIEGVEPGKTISIEFVVQEGLIKEIIKKDVLISNSKLDSKSKNVNYLIIIGPSLFSLLGLFLIALPMIIVKKIKGSKKR